MLIKIAAAVSQSLSSRRVNDATEVAGLASPDSYGASAGLPGASPSAVLGLKAPAPAVGILMDDLIPSLFESLDNDRFGFDGDTQRLRLRFDLSAYPAHYLDALGIAGSAPLVVHVDWPKQSMRNGRPWFGGSQPPKTMVTLGDARPVWKPDLRPESSDKLLAQARNMVESFHAQHWPPTHRKAASGYLPALHAFLAERLTHLGDFCVVCAELQATPGIKPVACETPACEFSYEQMGVGAGMAEITNRPEVADLLLSMAASAAIHPETLRRDHLFSTIPVDFLQSTTDGKKQVLWQELIHTFKSLPSIADMQASTNLQTCLAAADPRAFPLVRWVLSSWRGHLTPLGATDRIAAMLTPHQFRVCVNSPAHEKRFAELKAKHGSKFLFHGSGFFNWHAILRESLKSCSGTVLQSTGKAYGDGIYLGADSGVSTTYAKQAPTRQASRFGDQPRCLALCEVIDDETHKRHGGIEVHADAAGVALRYLFVFDKGHIPNVRASDLTDICRQQAQDTDAALALFSDTRARLSRREKQLGAVLPRSAPGDRQAETLRLPATSYDEFEDSDDAGSDAASDASGSYASSYELFGDDEDDGLYEATPPVQDGQSRQAVREDLALHQRFGQQMSTGMQKRLVKEIRDLARAHTREEGFEAGPVDDADISLWEAKIWAERDTSLWQQLQQFKDVTGRDHITLGLRFEGDYPNQPPFVWVKSPVFKLQTAFVSRGAVCNQLLVNGIENGWSPVNTAESVLRDIRTNLNDPSARAEIDNPHRDSGYSEAQARAGYVHALRLHGWGR